MKIWDIKVKICKKCDTNKPFSSFYKDKRTSTGYDCFCKECKLLIGKKWTKDNLERSRAHKRKWYNDNKEQAAVYKVKHVKSKRAYYNSKEGERRATKLAATPSWIDTNIVDDIYEEARYQGMEVDHIIPLKSKTVCGLHWEGNMQLLTKSENCSKGNRYLGESHWV